MMEFLFFLKRNALPVLSLLVFSASCIFVCPVYSISYFSRFAAEAGMKGEMSHFLDAPDA